MKRYINYLKYVLKHKYYVLIECWREGLYWQGLVHDMDKFLPGEFIPYARFFFYANGDKAQKRNPTGYYKPYDTGDEAFDYAWFLHQKRNKHHWQYWIVPHDGGAGVKPIEIPIKYVTEMMCDWKGAGAAQGTPDTRKWYYENKDKLVLHKNTRGWIESMFGIC